MRSIAAWTAPPPRCGHHGCYDGWREPVVTVANVVTAGRLVLVLGMVLTGVLREDTRWVLAALPTYLLLDMLDGILARRLGQETRGGALFDVLADRASSMAIWITWGVTHPEVLPVILLYAVEFVVVDGLLSTLWLAWPLLSCNHVGRVDRLVWRLNWSTPGKAANSGVLLLFVLVWPQPVLGVLAVAGILVMKTWCLVRLQRRLPAPPPGCAVVRTTDPSRSVGTSSAS